MNDHSSFPKESKGVIREAAPNDAVAIESLYRELVADRLILVIPEQVADMAKAKNSFLLVAEVDGKVCGTALLSLCQDAMYRSQPFGVIENLIVTASMRGRGLGRMLLAQIEQLAITHHCTKLMLLSSSARHEAHAFFQRCGFNGETKRAFLKYRRDFMP
jgi:N-acetylglutamate synthase-like GNAT family acetyltransferase